MTYVVKEKGQLPVTCQSENEARRLIGQRFRSQYWTLAESYEVYNWRVVKKSTGQWVVWTEHVDL